MQLVDRTKTAADYGFTFKKSNPTTTTVGIGVYELPTGEIYLVKPNQDGDRLYAKRMVLAPAERRNLEGNRTPYDFDYERGAIFKLKPEYQMSWDRAKTLMVQYGRCILCGRLLKRAESLERMMGRTCAKKVGRYFPDLAPDLRGE